MSPERAQMGGLCAHTNSGRAYTGLCAHKPRDGTHGAACTRAQGWHTRGCVHTSPWMVHMGLRAHEPADGTHELGEGTHGAVCT